MPFKGFKYQSCLFDETISDHSEVICLMYFNGLNCQSGMHADTVCGYTEVTYFMSFSGFNYICFFFCFLI